MSGAVEGVALLPCPFCGGEATAYEGRYTSSVKCDNSHAMHEYKPTLAEAIAAWNTRTTPPARSYADGVEDAAKVADDYALGALEGGETLIEATAEVIAAAIRLLPQEPQP